MARKSDRNRRGFTLVELIVVIGLMGLLGTISIGGYFAASRGMAARGVVQGTASLIRQAMQTCLIDQTPTAVLFLNKWLNKNDSGEGHEAYGVAIAIKMVGRISYVAGNGKTLDGDSLDALLIDEFADWEQSYPTDASKSENQTSLRLYRMYSTKDGYNSLKNGIEKCCSLMCAWVGYTDWMGSDYMVSARSKVEEWCEQANHKLPSNVYRWGLPFHSKNKWLGKSDWRVGDAYGVEIATLDLPKNYIFGTQPPGAGSTKLEKANSPSSGVLVFTPGDVTGANNYKFSGVPQIQVSRLNDMDGTDKTVVGTIDNDMLEDKN